MTKSDGSMKGFVLKIAPVALAALLIIFAADFDSEQSAEASTQQRDRLVKGAPDMRIGDPVIMSMGGPDSYGYRWIDSDSPGGPAFEWNDISGVGFPLALQDDDDVSLSLPFTFYFYGTSQSVVRVGSNGFLTFDVSGTQWLNDSIPSATPPDDIIAPFWDDLDPINGGTVYYYHDTGEDEFIVQYDSIPHHSEPTGLYSFQVILRPNGDISFRYLDMNGTTNSATIGIEDPIGSMGLEVVFNASYVHDSLAVDIWPVYDVPALYSTIQAGIDAAIGIGDTVLVATGTYTGLGNKDLTFDGKSIVLTSDEGADSTVIDCEGIGRAIIFNNFEDSTAVMDGFMITNGDSSEGGGIYMSSCSPTIRNCSFTGNIASAQGGGIYLTSSDPNISNCTFTENRANFGGGIYMRFSNPNILYCSFAQDTANSSGGGLYLSVSSSATISNCTITQNLAANGDGGGMNINGSSPTMSACTLSVNTASNGGGGIHSWQNASPVIMNCIISGNASGSFGGGSSTAGATPTFVDCGITGNTTGIVGGGGIYTNFTMILNNCTITENVSSSGGGIKVDSGSPTVTSCTIAGNTANVGGGIRTEQGSPTFLDCSITGNLATSSGGGLYASYESTPTFMGCTLAGNRAVSTGGGIYADQDSAMSFTRSVVWGNCAGSTGEQVWVSLGDSIFFTCCDIDSSGIVNQGIISYVSDNIFSNPLFCDPMHCTFAPATAGDYTLAANSPCLPPYSPCGQLIGALGNGCAPRSLLVPANFATIQLAIDAADPGDTVTVSNGTYTGSGNKDLDFGGKNIVLMSENGPGLTIIDCEGVGRGIAFSNFEDSTSVVDGFTITNGNATWGGGIFVTWDEDPTIKNCIITNCVATGSGGGIYCEGAGYFENCAVLNDSSATGGGVYCDETEFTNCFIAGNRTGGGGGGVSTRGGTFDGCTITGNEAYSGGGVATRAESGAAHFTNCTISGNTATSGGGMALISDGIMTNCILWGNCGGEAEANASLDFFCSDVDSSGMSGGGTISYDVNTIYLDPLFCDAAPCIAAPTVAGEYTLHANSPCLPDSSPCSLLIGALAEACSSRVFEVGDSTVYPTIQSAIDATSQPGDTVLVSDSTWTGTGNTVLNFGGRNIVLISENGPATTIINCEGSARGILFENNEDSTAVVDGFTIINGDSAEPGSAILITDCSPTIRNCIMTENKADSGVVRVDGGSPLFSSCTMQDDTTTTSNGLLMVTGGTPTFFDFVAQGNHANQCVSLEGGAPFFLECAIQNNTANNAVLISTPSTFVNTAIIGNSGNGMYFTTAPASYVDSCSVSGNGEWGIVLDATTSIFNNCDIKQNMGGGLLITGAVPPPFEVNSAKAPMDTCYCSEFNTCDFAGNVNTTSQGGGCRIEGGTPEVPFTPEFRYCTFSGNTSILDGGGIAVVGTAVSADISPRFQNCTISANTCGGEGGGIYMGVKALGAGATATLDRTILWGNCTIGSNSAQAYVDSANSVIFNCSNVANYGFEGKGTVDFGDSVTYGLPFFCETVVCDPQGTIEGNFSLAANSAASPDSNPCHVLIGAHPVATCDPTHVPVVPELPSETVLQHVAPNPFNPTTVIQFDLAKQSHVSLRIYDVSGRLVRSLIEEIMPQARHRMTWDGADNHGSRVATGVYFLRLSAGDVVQTRKMVLIK